MKGYSPMTQFNGKVAVITGAGSGIGRALALNLAAKGAKLALSDIDAEGLAETVRQVKALGAQVKSDRLNVAEREAVLAYADDVVAHFGQVHQVYNNAGVAYNGDVESVRFHLRAQRFDLAHRLGKTFGVDIRQRELDAFRSEVERQRPADAGPCTGDDGDLAVELSHWTGTFHAATAILAASKHTTPSSTASSSSILESFS